MRQGDVVRSWRFAYGRYALDIEDGKYLVNEGLIHVGIKTVTYSVTVNMSALEIATITVQNQVLPKNTSKVLELGAYDPSRATAQFVVFDVQESSNNGIFRCEVKARRLNPDGSYNPDGEVIVFYTSEHFLDYIDLKEIEVVGKMQMFFK